MITMQEALRELMGTGKVTKSTNINRNKSTRINEAVSSRRTKLPVLQDLWDQVYSTLAEVGENKIYAICGGKGKYAPEEVKPSHAKNKYDDNIIRVVYIEDDNEGKTKDKFFAEAKKVATKFGLKTSESDHSKGAYFNISVPQDEPVYFDLVPVEFRKEIATQNEEDFDNLPVSPNFPKDKVLKIKESAEETYFKDIKKLEQMYDCTFSISDNVIEGYRGHITLFFKEFKNIKTQTDFEIVVKDELGGGKITWEKKRFSQNESKQKVREEKSGTDRNSRNRNLIASVRKAAPLCVETKKEIEEIFAQVYNTVEEIIEDYAGAEQFIKENFPDVISWRTDFEDDTASWVIAVKTKRGDEKIYGESEGGPTSFITIDADDVDTLKY